MYLDTSGQPVFSPWDLFNFSGCRHATFLDIKVMDGEIEAPDPDDMEGTRRRAAQKIEDACLRQLEGEGKTVTEIPQELPLLKRVALTREAMNSGAEVIHRPAFPRATAPWHGSAKFLIRCEKPSELGEYSYEVLNTGMARTARPYHIMQLCVCSEILADLQGLLPENMHLFPSNEETRSFRASDYSRYCRHIKRHFEDYIGSLPSDSPPEPCNHCRTCRWNKRCKAQWEDEDHPSLVAGMRRMDTERLRRAGISTVAALAATSEGLEVPRMNQEMFSRLRSQAVLQRHKATTGENVYEVLPLADDKGFARMPPPDDGDLFLDLESDPFYPPKGLEYLFGVHFLGDGEEMFAPFWAHSHEEEKEAFARLMAFLDARLAQHPRAHIYHYGSYEINALKRLAGGHAVCERILDNLLRSEKFVDIYKVVRESVRTSEPGYSLKDLEVFYMGRRSGEVVSALESVAIYEKWRETKDDALLKQIADYNREDCRSTRLLRNWLLKLRPEGAPWFESLRGYVEEKSERRAREAEYELYKERLEAADDSAADDSVYKRLSHLLEFHNREAKTQWWRFFDRRGKSEQDLIDDVECLGGLRLVKALRVDSTSIYIYRFPPQEYKLRLGSDAVNIADTGERGKIIGLSDKKRIVGIRFNSDVSSPPGELSVGPYGPISTSVIRAALYRYADYLLKDPDGRHAATELLAENIPRIHGREADDVIIASGDLRAEALEAVAGLDSSYLFIQGPPGAGKTHTSADIIVSLMERGKQVGVTSNSHKAIHNLLEQIEDAADERGVSFRGFKKAGGQFDEVVLSESVLEKIVSGEGDPGELILGEVVPSESAFDGQFIESVFHVGDMDPDADLFAGTAWAFSSPNFVPYLDYLLVDEAGQVSIANVVAMSMIARNVVLVGDQMQLGQPVQGTHPGESGLSLLEFLLRDHSIIPAGRGIFLDKTYRMRPSICEFVSEAFYEGRLESDESTLGRNLNLKDVDLPDEGIVLIPMNHEGCSQKSEEEGAVIKEKYEALLGQSFTDETGETRDIGVDDILVVAPYNVQTNYLRSRLPEGARVGTIDKFQGQESPIVLISMTTSDGEHLPRHFEFLYSGNRLNVALSRAQCLAVIVLNRKLLEVPCRTVEQMRLVNTFCFLYEKALRTK